MRVGPAYVESVNGNARASSRPLGKYQRGIAIGLLVVGTAAVAQQATDIEGSWLDALGQDILSVDSMASAASFAGVPDQTVVSLGGELPTHDPTVGKVAGEGDVAGGAATYTIPIVVLT